ncbi:hypothetical protein JXQ70_06720 [bacterium]|nr:hypothetical protein [bacterium]
MNQNDKREEQLKHKRPMWIDLCVLGLFMTVLGTVGTLTFRQADSVQVPIVKQKKIQGLDPRLLSDEIFHYRQVRNFSEGNYSIVPELTTLPGYHAVIAAIVRLTGSATVDAVRLSSTVLGLLAILVFFFVSRCMQPDCALPTSLTFFCMPVFLPFLFLIYTDVFSFLIIMSAYWCACSDRPLWAGLIGLMSLFVRQDNLPWLLLLVPLVHWAKYGTDQTRLKIWHTLCRNWVLWTVMLLFIVFLLVNRGVAIGNRQMHPAFGLGLANIYLFLFLAFFLFLPSLVVSIPNLARRCGGQPWSLLMIIPLFIVYLATFKTPHPFNQSRFSYYLTNQILEAMQSSLFIKSICFLPILVAGLYLFNLKLIIPFHRPIQLVIVLALVAHPLVQIRYYLVPLALFILFQKRTRTMVDYVQAAFFLVLSLIMLPGIAGGRFFP